MSVWGMIVLGLVVVAALGFVLLQRKGASRVSSIDRAGRDRTALLVIDVQEDYTQDTRKRKWPRGYVEERLARINALAQETKRAGDPVIVVRHQFEGFLANSLIHMVGEGLGTATSGGLGLDPRLAIEADAEFIKHVGDSFSVAALNDYLAAHDVGRVRLVGLDGCYCIKSTALGALKRGYDVVIEEDAVLSINQTSWVQCKSHLKRAGAVLHPQNLSAAAE